MNDGGQEKFARLMALSAIRTAQIKANPLPFLNEVTEENYRLRRCIQDAVMILSGADNFDIARELAPTLQPSIVETATARNWKAYDVLKAAKV